MKYVLLCCHEEKKVDSMSKRARCRDGRDHGLLRGAEEERSPPRRGATRTHRDGHECKGPRREASP